MFGRKNDIKKCEGCGSKIEDTFSYCPHCGNSFLDPRKEEEDFGMLGKNDLSDYGMGSFPQQGFGITDKLIGSIFNNLMKNLDKQFKNQFNDIEGNINGAEVKAFPNGIRIKVSGPNGNVIQNKKPKKVQASVNRVVGDAQLRKMSTLPRAKAKTNVKRVGDMVVYELSIPGVETPEDVFVSKLESGYEIKAIGSKKVYVNSVPINLPLRRYSIMKNKLLVEFNAGHQAE